MCNKIPALCVKDAFGALCFLTSDAQPPSINTAHQVQTDQ